MSSFIVKNTKNNEIINVLEINFNEDADVLIYNTASKEFEILKSKEFRDNLLGTEDGELPIYEYLPN